MALNYEDLLNKMLDAAQGVLKENWPLVASTAKDRFQGLSQILINIENDKLRGELTEDEAKELFEMHKTAVKTALESIAGLGMLLVEAVINAAMGAIRDVVNTTIGWKIIP